MSTLLIRLGIAPFVVAGSLAANAAEVYFSDCAAGADAACVPGDNGNDGTNPATPKRNLEGFNVKSLAAGEHSLRFARGSALEINGIVYPANLKKATQSLVFTDYESAWGGTALPIIRFTSSTDKNSFNLAGFRLQDAGRGYTFRNLDIAGPGAPTYHGTGFFFYRNVSDVLIENVIVRDFGVGLYVAQQTFSPPTRIENVTVRNSRIVNNYYQGFLGGGYKTVLEGNVFDNNGFKDKVRYHNIYLSEYGENMVLRGNTLTRSAMVDGRCTGVSLVGHDHLVDTLIENNTIVELEAGWGCYGIQINGYNNKNKYMGFDRTVIRGNTVVLGGSGSVGIGVNACPDCIIENNVVVGIGNVDFIGINVPDGSFTTAGSEDHAITVRNNSIYVNTPTGNTAGIAVKAPHSSDDTVVSNLIYFGPRSNANAKCFSTAGRELSSYSAFANNLCFRNGGAKWSDQHPTLAAAQAAGWDRSSATANPLLAAPPSAANDWRMSLQSGSPAINAGRQGLSAAKDVLNKLRNAVPDIGAFESGNAPAPAPGSPTGVVVQ